MEGFENAMRKDGLCESSVRLYSGIVRMFLREHGAPGEESVRAYKGELVAGYAPSTVNSRIKALNRYLCYIGRGDLRMTSVPEPRPSFADDVVEEDDYLLLKSRLLAEGRERDYFAVWTMAATGVRISELLLMTRADLEAGFADVHGKGGKVRRVWIPTGLRREARAWATREGIEGRLFLNRCGEPITARGLAQQVKECARRCGIEESRVHPHAFRHYFAKRCLACGGVDLPTLADMLGHSSIETTRIYLRRSSREQRALVDRVVTW